MEEKQFREELENLLETDAPLDKIKEHFDKNKPKDFDINANMSQEKEIFKNPLMECLKFGANVEVFQYFVEKQGGKITQAVSGLDNNIDGQKIPFSIDKDTKQMKYNSTGLTDYNLSKEDVQVKTKLGNAQDILSYIDKNTSIDEKNNMRMLHLSSYYLDDKMFDKLLHTKGIDVNIKGARESNIIRFTAFDTSVRGEYFDKALKHKDVIVGPAIIQQATMFESFDVFKIVINKLPKSEKIATVKSVLDGLMIADDKKEILAKMEYIAKKDPKGVKQYIEQKSERMDGMDPFNERELNGKKFTDILLSEAEKNKGVIDKIKDAVSKTINNISKLFVKEVTPSAPPVPPVSLSQAQTPYKIPDKVQEVKHTEPLTPALIKQAQTITHPIPAKDSLAKVHKVEQAQSVETKAPAWKKGIIPVKKNTNER